jgi:hypothetical protein
MKGEKGGALPENEFGRERLNVIEATRSEDRAASNEHGKEKDKNKDKDKDKDKPPKPEPPPIIVPPKPSYGECD